MSSQRRALKLVEYIVFELDRLLSIDSIPDNTVCLRIMR